MGEPDQRAAARNHLRKQLKRDLGPYRTHLKDLLDHIAHMDQGDLDQLQHVLVMLQGRVPAAPGEILNALQSIHDDAQCQQDKEREGITEHDSEPERRMSTWETFTHAWRNRHQPGR